MNTNPRLSPRQQELLRHLITGLTLKEAALQMCVSVNTTKRYMKDIRERLGAQTKEQAVALAVSGGLVAIGGYTATTITIAERIEK
jgi:two-component system NarL family response regulator